MNAEITLRLLAMFQVKGGKLLRCRNDAARKRLIEAGLATNLNILAANERPCCLRKELIKVDEKDLTLRALSSKVKALEAP